MRRATTLALPAAIGVAAGLRSMTAPAIVAWAAKRRLIRVGGSSFASLIVGSFSRKVINLAITELLVDKLPFAPDRTSPGPLAWRALSGSACGAAIATAIRRPAWEGAALGAGGAILGAVAGQYARNRAGRSMPNVVAAVAEDAIAIGLAAAVAAASSPRR